MRIVLLIMALLLALPVSAQVFPENLSGIQAAGVYNTHLVGAEAHNMPISIPIDQSVAWVATLTTAQMPPLPTPLLVQYTCLENGRTGQCIAAPPTMYVNGQWPWNHDTNSYVRLRDWEGGAIKEVDAFVFNGTHWDHITGVVEYTGGCCPWYDWEWFYRETQVSPEPPFYAYIPSVD